MAVDAAKRTANAAAVCCWGIDEEDEAILLEENWGDKCVDEISFWESSNEWLSRF